MAQVRRGTPLRSAVDPFMRGTSVEERMQRIQNMGKESKEERYKRLLAVAEEEMHAAMEDRDKVQRENVQLHQEVDKLQQEKEDLVQDNVMLQQQQARLERENASIWEDYEKGAAQMKEQEAWEKSAMANIKRLNEAISKQQIKIDGLITDKQKLTAQIEETKKAHATQVTRAKEESGKAQAALTKKLEQAEKKLTATSAAQADLKEELQQVQQTLSEQKSAYVELEAEIERQERRVRELEREAASVSVLKDRAELNLGSHRLQLEAAQREVTHLKDELHIVERAAGESSAALLQANADKKALEAELTQKQAQIDEYIDVLQRDCDWAQAAARESDAAAAIATERAEAAEGKLASLSQEAERAVEKVARLEQELAVAKTATEEMRGQLQITVAHLDTAKKEAADARREREAAQEEAAHASHVANEAAQRAAGQAAQDRAAQPPAEAAQPPSDAAQPHMTIVQEVVEEEELHGPLDLPMQGQEYDVDEPDDAEGETDTEISDDEEDEEEAAEDPPPATAPRTGARSILRFFGFGQREAPAPPASKARDLEEELDRAANTPLPEDADNTIGDQQAHDTADGPAQQDVFATPASPASAQGRSASKSGTASRDPRPHSAGRQAAPASAADDNGDLSAGRKRAAPSSAGADAEGASSGARAKRSKLAPISTEAEAGEAEPDQTPIPEPGSPAAHTRSHDHGGICIEDVVPSAQPQPENEAAPEEAEPEQEEAAPEVEQPEEAPGPSEQHAELAKAPEPEQATAGAATEHEEVPAAPKQPGRRGRKPAFQKATESAAAEPAEAATATEDAQPAEDHTEAAPEKEVVIKKPRRGRPPSKSTSSAQTAPPALPEGPAAPKRRGRPAKSLGFQPAVSGTGEEVEQSPKNMRSRGTRKLSDVQEAPEDDEGAEATAEEDAAPVKAPTKRRGRLPKAALATASAAEASTGNSAPAPSAPAAEKPARKRGRPSKADLKARALAAQTTVKTEPEGAPDEDAPPKKRARPAASSAPAAKSSKAAKTKAGATSAPAAVPARSLRSGRRC